MLIAAGCGSARMPTCEEALRAGRTKFYHVIGACHANWFEADRFRYDLVFDGWLDDRDAKARHLCETRFRTARIDFSPVLVRALSLFAPGELRALRVLDVDVLCLVTLLMRTSSAGGAASQIEQSIVALRAIQVDDSTGAGG
jgi:hypothetical protein